MNAVFFFSSLFYKGNLELLFFGIFQILFLLIEVFSVLQNLSTAFCSRVTLCSPSWSGILHVGQAGLEFNRYPPASSS